MNLFWIIYCVSFIVSSIICFWMGRADIKRGGSLTLIDLFLAAFIAASPGLNTWIMLLWLLATLIEKANNCILIKGEGEKL